jgi:hypothetical protein
VCVSCWRVNAYPRLASRGSARALSPGGVLAVVGAAVEAGGGGAVGVGEEGGVVHVVLVVGGEGVVELSGGEEFVVCAAKRVREPKALDVEAGIQFVRDGVGRGRQVLDQVDGEGVRVYPEVIDHVEGFQFLVEARSGKEEACALDARREALELKVGDLVDGRAGEIIRVKDDERCPVVRVAHAA